MYFPSLRDDPDFDCCSYRGQRHEIYGLLLPISSRSSSVYFGTLYHSACVQLAWIVVSSNTKVWILRRCCATTNELSKGSTRSSALWHFLKKCFIAGIFYLIYLNSWTQLLLLESPPQYSVCCMYWAEEGTERSEPLLTELFWGRYSCMLVFYLAY